MDFFSLLAMKGFLVGGGSGGGGGSASIDVTASVGQTFVAEEVDANGKPTKWKAVDYQPRTHWTEEVVVMSETTLAVEEGVAFTELDDIYVAGKEYKVTFNGEEYLCPAVDIGGAVAVGNVDILMDTGDNGIPFASLWEDGLGFMVFDDSTSITVSVAEVNYTPIPMVYIPEYVYKVDVSQFTTSQGSDGTPLYEYIPSEIPKALIMAAYNGIPLYLLVTDESGNAVKMPASFSMSHLVATVEGGVLDEYTESIPTSVIAGLFPYLYARGYVGISLNDYLVRFIGSDAGTQS